MSLPSPLTILALTLALGVAAAPPQTVAAPPSPGAVRLEPTDPRMAWWSDARFGLFIHWGLYAIPAGVWANETGYGEWIRSNAKIPLAEYEKFQHEFNPVDFNADAWVKAAKEAGFRYIVITTKHHDGFCLFASKLTDWSVMGTPFHRDIMKELADACHRQGMKLGFYHSIMDWHHPDYLPRRDWEQRPTEGADFARYQAYLKGQLKELLTNYGPIAVLWFDGQWENTWTHAMGLDLYQYVRSLQPGIIVNNRVDKGGGQFQLTTDGGFAGDYGTPEQEIPPTGLPGVAWETCMTMNDHWGFNRADQAWKSPASLIQRLADIASKGGNFLLNVGPTDQGAIPEPSLERMKVLGAWLRVNGSAIYGTQASPFAELPWGRCTQKREGTGTLLFFHVFDWPRDGKLEIKGLFNPVRRAYLLADPGQPLRVTSVQGRVEVALPAAAVDPADSVVAVEVAGTPEVAVTPVIAAATPIFTDRLDVTFAPLRPGFELHYTLDGREPAPSSPVVRGTVQLAATATVKARFFRGATPASAVTEAHYVKVEPKPAAKPAQTEPGLGLQVFVGDFQRCEDMKAAARTGVARAFTLEAAPQPEHYGLRFEGYVDVPVTGTYGFSTLSDDGSVLFVDGAKVVDNDGPHGPREATGAVGLARGLHKIRVDYFQGTGGAELQVHWQGPDMPRQPIGPADLKH